MSLSILKKRGKKYFLRFSKKLEAVYFSLMRGDFGGNVGFHLKAALVGSMAFLNFVTVKKTLCIS